MARNKYETAGWRESCFYYDPCPICYGCRNYHTYCHSRCDFLCGDNLRKNVCTSKLHTPENFAKMIRRPYVDLDKLKKE